MSPSSDRAVIGRRIVLFTAVFALIILAGVILYFMFYGEVDPLLGSGLPITSTVTT